LYLGSFDECAKKPQLADDRSIHITDYGWFAKSGNSKKMMIAKKQFPSQEDIFCCELQER